MITLIKEMPDDCAFKIKVDKAIIKTKMIEVESEGAITSIKINSHEINNCVSEIVALFKPGMPAQFYIKTIGG